MCHLGEFVIGVGRVLNTHTQLLKKKDLMQAHFFVGFFLLMGCYFIISV